ncbi:MAG: TolC family protein [Flavobacterium sp.]
MKSVRLFILFMSVCSLWAQETPRSYSFSLQEAIAHGLEYNYSVINSGRDIVAARKKKWETTAIGLPQVSARVDYQNNIVIQKSVVPAEFFGGNQGEFVEVAFGTKQNMNAGATLTQILFDGSYLVALKASKTYLDFFEQSKNKTDIDTKASIIEAYGQVLLVEETIKIFQKNKLTLEANLKETKAAFDNGLAEEESVEQIQINLATLTNTINNNIRLREITQKMLKVMIGIEINDSLVLTDSLDQLTEQNIVLDNAASNFELEKNIDYRLGLNFSEQKRLLMLQEKSKALPTLAANANFGYNAFNDQFQFFTSQQKWLNYSFVGVSLNVPIFSSLARSARTQQAQIEFDKAKTSLTQLEQNLKLQHQMAKSEYQFSIETYQTAKNNLRLSERIENKQQIKFREGISTSFEFTEAQRQLYAAQQNLLSSMVEIINKRAALEKLTSN